MRRLIAAPPHRWARRRGDSAEKAGVTAEFQGAGKLFLKPSEVPGLKDYPYLIGSVTKQQISEHPRRAVGRDPRDPAHLREVLRGTRRLERKNGSDVTFDYQGTVRSTSSPKHSRKDSEDANSASGGRRRGQLPRRRLPVAVGSRDPGVHGARLCPQRALLGPVGGPDRRYGHRGRPAARARRPRSGAGALGRGALRVASLVLCDAPTHIPRRIHNDVYPGEASTADALAKYGVAQWCAKTIDYRLDTRHADPRVVEWYIEQMGRTPGPRGGRTDELFR